MCSFQNGVQRFRFRTSDAKVTHVSQPFNSLILTAGSNDFNKTDSLLFGENETDVVAMAKRKSAAAAASVTIKCDDQFQFEV